MSGLLSGLYIGVSGLQTSQNALNTTAHNLANVDSAGYVRQQVLLQDTMYQSLKVDRISYNQVGYGVTTQIVRQVRDQFLDKSYRLEVGRQGFYDAQYTAVSELETVFGELEGEAFQDSIEEFWVTIQEIVKDPTNIVQKGQLVQSAVSLIERAELLRDQIVSYQVNLNTEIIDTVNNINSIGEQIHALNKEILKIESADLEQANDLRDARNLLLDELSQMAHISYKENANGVVTVNIEGVQFISEDSVNYMDVEKVSDSSDMLKPVWPHIKQDVYEERDSYSSNDNTDIGYLQGLLVARGEYAANYTDIETLNGTSTIMTVQAQFDQLIHGIVTGINDILCPNKTITIYENGVAKEIQVLDEENAPVGTGVGNDIAGTELFSRKSTPRYTEVEVYLTADDEANGILTTVRMYNEEDPSDNYSLYTLGEIEVNPEVLQNLSLLPLYKQGGTGEHDNAVCEQLAQLWEKDFSSLGPGFLTTYSIKDYYAAMIGNLATVGNTVNSIATNQGELTYNIDSQRTAVTGVSSDEELSNLIRYQHAYNAAARYINVVDEMLEHVVTRL